MPAASVEQALGSTAWSRRTEATIPASPATSPRTTTAVPSAKRTLTMCRSGTGSTHRTGTFLVTSGCRWASSTRIAGRVVLGVDVAEAIADVGDIQRIDARQLRLDDLGVVRRRR